MKYLILLLALLVSCTPVSEKLFVANEESGTISIIDATALTVIDTITLTTEHDGTRLEYAPHNVQVVGNLVLVTANVGGYAHDDHGIVPAAQAHGEEDEEHSLDHPDQLILIDARTHKIVKRYDVAIGAHLAHVVSDGTFAYATLTNDDSLSKINLETGLQSNIMLPFGSKPHGLRLSADNKTAYIASMNNSLLILNLTSKNITALLLPGMGVQTAVTSDYAFVSVYSPPQIGRYNLRTGNMSIASLTGAQGPIQLYPTPDGKFIYAADQGTLLGKDPGYALYKLNADTLETTRIPAGNAPHGVVISPDGRVFVTNLLGGSVSVFVQDEIVTEIPVGAAPNGITYWPHNI